MQQRHLTQQQRSMSVNQMGRTFPSIRRSTVPKNLTTDACDYVPNFGAASFVRPMISVRIAGVTEMRFSTSLKGVGAL